MNELIGADRITLTYINMATLLFQIDTKGTVSYLATELVSFIRQQNGTNKKDQLTTHML